MTVDEAAALISAEADALQSQADNTQRMDLAVRKAYAAGALRKVEATIREQCLRDREPQWVTR